MIFKINVLVLQDILINASMKVNGKLASTISIRQAAIKEESVSRKMSKVQTHKMEWSIWTTSRRKGSLEAQSLYAKRKA